MNASLRLILPSRLRTRHGPPVENRQACHRPAPHDSGTNPRHPASVQLQAVTETSTVDDYSHSNRHQIVRQYSRQFSIDRPTSSTG
jgi:hypothetical protein